MSARKGGGRASKAGALGFTLLALLLTILTMVLGARFLSNTQYANEPVVDVVVAKSNLPASEVILEDALTTIKWPQSTVPEGAFNSIDDFLGPEPRVPVNTIFAGEPIIPARLASAKSGTGMASLVPRTMRGFPVPVDSWIAEARLVYPGAYVDVLTTLRDAMTRKATTKLVLQAVRVLAVDGNIDAALQSEKKREGNKAVVTLLVTPEQAEILALSAREGKVDLMLRNANDDSMVDTLGIDPNELLGVEEEEEDPAAAAAAIAADDPPPRRRRRRRRRSGASRVRPVPTSPGEADAIRRGQGRQSTGRVKTVELGGP